VKPCQTQKLQHENEGKDPVKTMKITQTEAILIPLSATVGFVAVAVSLLLSSPVRPLQRSAGSSAASTCVCVVAGDMTQAIFL